MAQYATLKAAIDAVIKANGQREITGTVLNQTLNAMVNSLGADYQFAGVATPSTNPGTPDQNVFYLAFEAGTYTNFNATVLSAGISILMWNGSWSSQTFYTIDATPTASSNNLVSSGAVFDAIKTDGSAYDVSAHFPTGGPNSDGKFTLEYILSNADTLIPTAWRKGGMSIRFVHSSDNKYVQYRYMSSSTAAADFTNADNWQGVDDEPTAGSDNLIKSGGVVEAIEKLPSVAESETDLSIEDKNGNALAEFYDGHFRTKEFDSKNVQEDIIETKEQIEDLETKTTHIVDNRVEGLLFSDINGNVVGGWKDGHEVSKYPSAYTKGDNDGSLDIEDVKGNKVLSVKNGHIRTKYFWSKDLTDKVNEIYQNGAKKKISILFVGNSLTQDAMAYVPYLLKQIAPEIEFKFYIYFTGGFTLSEQYTNFINEWAPGTFSVCENIIRWTNNATWESGSSILPMKEWLKRINFDVLCLQDYFTVQNTSANAVRDFNNCVNYIRDNYSGVFKVVTLFHRPRTNVFDPRGPQTTEACFNLIKEATELCMKNTCCQSIIPPGIAAYRALESPILQPLGDIGNLTPDGSHAQDGLPCLMESYSVLLWIFKELGIPKGIYNSTIRMTQAIFNTINVPGPNVGSGIIVGTDAENNEAQLIAVKSYKEGEYITNNSLINI